MPRLKLKGKVFRQETITYRQLKEITVNDFKEAWEEGIPDDIFLEKDPTIALEILEYKIHRALDQIAPEITIRTKPNYSPWFKSEHRKLVEERDYLKKQANLYGTKEAEKAFKKMRNKVSNVLKKARFDWHRENLMVDDAKKMWDRVKKLAGMSKTAVEDMMINTGTEILDKAKDLASYMNSFFKAKVKKLQDTLTLNKDKVMEYAKEYLDDKYGDMIKTCKFETVGTGKVAKVIRSLKNTGSRGRDNLSTAILKQFGSVLAAPFRHIINQSIRTGIYPEG